MWSLSARRAWIEIPTLCVCALKCAVALRKESVDRNVLCLLHTVMQLVALRKESVDRNHDRFIARGQLPTVALRKESVDRNYSQQWHLAKHPQSLSARRAWIEITYGTRTASRYTMSLSARRAWIEILVG